MLIFGFFAGGTHFDDFGVEATEDIDEIGLGGHDGFDVFVDAGDFVKAGGEEVDAGIFELFFDGAPGEGLEGFGAAHDAAGAVGSGVKGGGVAFAAHDIAGSGHGAGDDAEDTVTSGGGTFAVDDDFATVMGFLPGEVVVIFDVEEDVGTNFFGDVSVDDVVVGGGVATHKVHGGPVFLSVGFVEGEPGEVFELVGEFVAARHGAFAVNIADLGTGAA